MLSKKGSGSTDTESLSGKVYKIYFFVYKSSYLVYKKTQGLQQAGTVKASEPEQKGASTGMHQWKSCRMNLLIKGELK